MCFQVQYAASDALYAMDAFLQLVAIKFEDRKIKSAYFGTDVYTEEEDFWKKARSMCQGECGRKQGLCVMYQDECGRCSTLSKVYISR